MGTGTIGAGFNRGITCGTAISAVNGTTVEINACDRPGTIRAGSIEVLIQNARLINYFK